MRVQQLPTTVHANRFHVAVGLFVNGSQTGRQNVVKKKKWHTRRIWVSDALITFWRPDCDLLLNRHTATWNLLACTVVGVRSFHLSACPPTHHQWEPIKVHLKYCICIFLAAVLKQSRKYQQYCAIVTDLDVADDPRYLHGCVELWYASSSSTRAQVRFTMHFECQVTKEGISVSCKPSERQAKVC